MNLIQKQKTGMGSMFLDKEEIALDGHDDISIDEDAVPKQKVVIDNEVRCHSPLDGGVIDIVTPSMLRCVVYVKR